MSVKPHIDSPVPNPKDYDSEEAYGAALDAYGEMLGWTDDHLDLMDELASIRVTGYRIDEQRRAGEKAARENGTVVAPGNKCDRPS